MSEQLQPSTSSGRLFYAMGRGDVAEVTRWQLAFNEDFACVKEVELMSTFAIEELVAAGPRKFRLIELARIHHKIINRGLPLKRGEVQDVLNAASGRISGIARMESGRRMSITLAAYPIVAADFGITDPALIASVLKAEERYKEAYG